MNLNSVKRALRGWLPLQPSNLQKIRENSTPIAIGLVITILSVSVFMVFSNALSGYSGRKDSACDSNCQWNSTRTKPYRSNTLPSTNNPASERYQSHKRTSPRHRRTHNSTVRYGK